MLKIKNEPVKITDCPTSRSLSMRNPNLVVSTVGTKISKKGCFLSYTNFVTYLSQISYLFDSKSTTWLNTSPLFGVCNLNTYKIITNNIYCYTQSETKLVLRIYLTTKKRNCNYHDLIMIKQKIDIIIQNLGRTWFYNED